MTTHDVSSPKPPASTEDILEEIDNPIERLKLLAEDDEGMARYLDAMEVTGPREREMLKELSRTRPLAMPDRFPVDHRQMVEALESLSRHGFKGTTAGESFGPLRPVVVWMVGLVARYLVVSNMRSFSTSMRNLYGLREAQAVPGTRERLELHRARVDAERMVGALEQKELGLPTFILGGAAVPVVASVGRVTGVLTDTLWASVIGAVGMLIALVVSWTILRGAALASRRIRLALAVPSKRLWQSIGWCGNPPKNQTRTFVFIAVSLTLGAWIILPILVGIAIAA